MNKPWGTTIESEVWIRRGWQHVPGYLASEWCSAVNGLHSRLLRCPASVLLRGKMFSLGTVRGQRSERDLETWRVEGDLEDGGHGTTHQNLKHGPK